MSDDRDFFFLLLMMSVIKDKKNSSQVQIRHNCGKLILTLSPSAILWSLYTKYKHVKQI